MSDILQANSLNETGYYLMVTPCDDCGKGPWIVQTSQEQLATENTSIIDAICSHCQKPRRFRFTIKHNVPADGPESELINPSETPSKIVDLAQWVSLFYHLIESAASISSKHATRRTGFIAALCLAEALKFYKSDELPPESAFFSERTLAIFHGHPEKYARQHLRDMQAKLPTIRKMTGMLQQDQKRSEKKWWQFWGKDK